ncbi:MAG: leucyl aminopeptidase [Altererythrobacter sp.]|nr:leucyl aminopeptidase [Altererythrobacter sp.]
MQIKFTDTSPANPGLVAYVANQGSMPAAVEPVLSNGAEAARFKGRGGQFFEGFVERGDQTVRVAIAGAGDTGADVTKRAEALEKAGAVLAAKYLTSGESEIVLDLSEANLSASETASVLLGLRLRSWRHDAYRTKLKDEQKVSLKSATVVGASEGAEAAWDDTAAVAEGVEFTRDLIAEPANKLYPVSFVEMCQERFEGTGAELTVLDEDQMAELGMGALLGVGQGSTQPSRILAIKWNGGKDVDAPIAFVGKGVTFDTGGISLKPPVGMWDMKWDMGGSGAVAGAMLALVKRKAKANIVGVVGLVENMPDGNAQRPGDIVTSMSGQTIEVLNTDAEGRLVLCDALTWTQRTFKPSRIVDLATLTGAMIIALGKEYGGMFANDDDLADDLAAAGKQVGDKLWRLPLGPEYDKLINSPICDMKNIGPREGGSITAAQFLQRFIENDTPWAHLDIAGMVFSDKAGRTWDKGATGYGARLLDTFVRNTLEG